MRRPLAVLVALSAVAGTARAQDAPPEPSVETTEHQEPWRGWHAWPLLGHDVWTAPSGNVVRDRWSVLWPLFQTWTAPATEGAGFGIPWPVITAEWTPQYAHWRILPLAAYWRWDQDRALAIFPLGMGAWGPDRWSVVVPFAYAQGDPETFRAILFPVAWWFDEPDGGLRTLWPVFHWRWHTRDGRVTQEHLDLLPATVLPIGAWWAEAEHDDAYFGLAWPLLYGYRRHGEAWTMRFLFEGFVCWSDRADHSGWRILAGLFSYESWGPHAASYRWSIFWGLFAREVRDRTVR